MTVAQLIAEQKKFLAYDLDSYQGERPSTVSDADIVVLLNRAQITLAHALRPAFGYEAVTYTAGVPFVDLDVATPHRLQKVTSVKVGAQVLRDFRGKGGIYSEDEATAVAPAWREGGDTAGLPRIAVQSSRRLFLYPKPQAALTIKAAGTGLYLPLSESTPNQVPESPEEMHPAIAMLAAVIAAEPQITTEQQIQRLSRIDARIATLLQGHLAQEPR